ncbi:MAG TPA: AAA family ATPase [Candidatus Paceibacterota bacterium]|nr:AAA family ATPase [Candidatus Paceibacterota bacterium]
MKIKRIEYKKHNVFKNHTVILGDTDVPAIAFLVGNNGSGKTKVLDTIYQSFSEPFSNPDDFEIIVNIVFSEKEKQELSLTENEVNYFIKKENGGNTHRVNYISGGLVNVNIQSLSKVVFSTIEVNFNEQNIQSITSKNIDDNPKPKEKSQNLSVEIPQLLIDIKNLDDADISKWFKDNQAKGHTPPFPPVGTRLQRFTDAFHKVYEGEKTFSEIKNKNNSKKIIFIDKNGEEISLNELSTGEKQIIYRVGYILKNLGNMNGGIILIDEPEISLHPTWQIKLKDFLFEMFKDHNIQIIIATHSPYIFQKLDETKEVCIKVDRLKPESKKISMVFPNVPYNPSVQLINYLAYGIVDELLHIELYTLLQIREKRDKVTNSWNKVTNAQNQDGIENWLQDPSGGNVQIKQTFTRTGRTIQSQETIMTWIRNKIHHSDELGRPNFTKTDLQESIDAMITLLK